MMIVLTTVMLFITPACCENDNIALDKPTHQTGVYLDQGPERAVDGRLGSPNGDDSPCALVSNSKPGGLAEWWVDLQGLYVVYNVTVHNTYYTWAYTRMTDFCVGVLGPGAPEVCCGWRKPTVGPGESVTLSCPPNTVGWYVHFSRLGAGPSPNRVTLCEVEVTGQALVKLSGEESQPHIPDGPVGQDTYPTNHGADHVPDTWVETRKENPVTWTARDHPTQELSLTLAAKVTEMCEPRTIITENKYNPQKMQTFPLGASGLGLTENTSDPVLDIFIDALQTPRNTTPFNIFTCDGYFCMLWGVFGASLVMTLISAAIKIVICLQYP